MDGELRYQDSFQSLIEGEYRLFNPGMFKDMRNNEQVDPQQGDTYEHYQIDQDCSFVTKDDIKKSKDESIIDRFNNWDNPSNQQNQELKNSSSRVKTYSRGQRSKEDVSYQLIDQTQSQITQRKSVNYAEPEGIVRKCSNPKFMPNPMAAQKEELIRNLQLHDQDRQRYGESPYFIKKDRQIQENQIQQIFHRYKTLPTSNYQQEKADNTPKLQHLSKTEIKNPEKACKFCDVSKMKLHRQQAELEARVNQVNCSPARSLHEKYMLKEDRLHLQPREQYLEEGRLKAEYLKSISHSIERELKKLKDSRIGSIQSNVYLSTPRKKIFVEPDFPPRQEHIKIQDTLPREHNTFTPQTQKTLKPKRNEVYRNIFASAHNKKVMETNKRNQKSNSVDFGYVSTSLVASRIKIFGNLNSKGRNNQAKQQKAKSPVRLVSPLKEKVAAIFIQMDMNTAARKWFEENRQLIGVQTEKILSYELIKRYLSKEQIEQRLRMLVQRTVNPKKWLLSMVDEVYSRLKDRYFPS